MKEFEYILIDKENDSFRESIFEPLERFNHAHVGDSGYQPLGVNEVLAGTGTGAGLWGHTANGWLVVELLFIPEDRRAVGVGSRLVKMAETEAILRGCHSSWLDTFDYQAKGFYEKIGYTVFGQLDDYPSGTIRYFLSRKFAD